MAQSPSTQQEFHYPRVELFKAKTLGVGSYGAVCRAMCNELPCAAKILHPVMFQSNDPGSQSFLHKFEQECYFLRTIKHPNIVQYIATHQDPETGLPVLLMELMDESLTSFLEQSQKPLPYHKQVNLSYDIALALAYLHSNGIVHRDLSSNNILLIAGSRAKVTDFGMSKLIDANPRMTPLTLCPGTLVYMAPEALRNPPVYTKKLDCFSEGVLIIQIIARKFPAPGPDSQIIEDLRSPVGRIQIPVPEIERRQSHIDLIPPTHPLLPLIHRCLEYREENRPSAPELCRYLAILKEAPAYDQSLQQARERGTQADTEGGVGLQANKWQNQALQQQVQEKDRQLQLQQIQSQAKDFTIAEKEREIRQLRQEFQQTTQIRQQIQEKDQTIKAQEKQLQELKQHLQANEQVTAEFQRNLLEREKVVRDLEERLSEKEKLVQQLKQQLKCKTSGVARKITELKWTSYGIQRSVDYIQPAVTGTRAYFTSGRAILAYDSETDKWSNLPLCPYDYFVVTVVKGLITTIGGGSLQNPTNKLLSLTVEGGTWKWMQCFPPMPANHYRATALCTGRHLIVAGGSANSYTITNRVEVMDTDTRQWTTVSSLPYQVRLASATLCGDDVYMVGGYYQNGNGSRSVFRCSLNALLQSSSFHQVWKQVTDLPVTNAACATLQGRLLAIGGKDPSGLSTTAVHEYDPATNSWKVVSHMPTACGTCAVAVLPGNRLMVVSGKTVLIGTLQ